MTDLLTQKNTEAVNFQPKKKYIGDPRHVYCKYLLGQGVVEILLRLVTSCYGTQTKLWIDGPLKAKSDLTWTSFFLCVF